MYFFTEIFSSFVKGLVLGGSVCLISFVLDKNYCSKSFEVVCNTIPKLYIDGIFANLYNMILIGPITYSIIDYALIDHTDNYIQPLNLSLLVLVHNGFYYIAHYYMHKPFLYHIHKFHHNYDNVLLPSLGNAVSSKEFFIAYMLPFIIGAKLFHPNEVTFISSISIIAILNMAIHTKELEDTKWAKYLVSPNQHIEHHKVKTKHYAAPLLNIDYLLQKDDIKTK